ncbi:MULTISPECIES: Scr1 family TA system antitoxin-like transcriptional regulator [Streptacidiphilus]|uniref:Scr1 family TA system antitoxin-like transcriptional regulator n=1 Tax=Streptacidiphilus cavernicola TaxID=3342716 RepID=A0ABV6UYL5_9ACTN|nr:Scr1 family TA system antitoxin-like transcriptional regulator [Streptacidiphilus jeojiense]
MSRSPSSSAQQARERVAARLHELRSDARLTTRALAEACGWAASKVSRIENAITAPSDADLWAWCRACGVAALAPDLEAMNRQADELWTEWHRRHRPGLLAAQERQLRIDTEAQLQRSYSSVAIPGAFQTLNYTMAMLSAFNRFHDGQAAAPDIEAAAAKRQERSRLLRSGKHRFVVLIEEHLLLHRFGSTAILAEQLQHLAELQRLPGVAMGIVPLSAERPAMWCPESFHIYDRARVSVETLTAIISITVPADIALYEKAFGALGSMAVYGPAATRRIERALDVLLL